MAEIYICDDEPAWIERMEQAVASFMMGSDWGLKTACRTTLPGELLDILYRNGTLGGIYLLDIDLKSEMDGLELAAKIRDSDPEAVLIFVTTHDELVMDTFRYKLQAMDYILKDRGDLRSQIYDTLRTVESRYNHSAEKLAASRIRLETDGSYRFIVKKDVYFVESQKNRHKLTIHLRSEVLTTSLSLSNMTELLGNGFLLCRRGCLVNPLHITGANQSTREIVFDNGEKCRCSYRGWQHVVGRTGT